MFRLNRNERSHWSGNGVHVESELVFMIGRNMQGVLTRRPYHGSAAEYPQMNGHLCIDNAKGSEQAQRR